MTHTPEFTTTPLVHECGGYWGETMLGGFKCTGCGEHRRRDDSRFTQGFDDADQLITVFAVRRDNESARTLGLPAKPEPEPEPEALANPVLSLVAGVGWYYSGPLVVAQRVLGDEWEPVFEQQEEGPHRWRMSLRDRTQPNESTISGYGGTKIQAWRSALGQHFAAHPSDEAALRKQLGIS